jgi:hypothetical protein
MYPASPHPAPLSGVRLAPPAFAALCALALGLSTVWAGAETPEPTPSAEETGTEGATPTDPAPEGLAVATTINYDVQPADERVHVTVDALATNQNPESVRREFGNVIYYLGYILYLPDAATDVVATSPAGATLPANVSPLVNSEGQTDEFFDQLSVDFDARFFFGESYQFKVEYNLPAQRRSNLVVTQNYFYFPAFADGTTSSVAVTVPAEEGYEATIDNPACTPATETGSFACTVDDPFTFLAWVEVVHEGSLGQVSQTVALDGRTVDLVIEYFEGEQAWAADVTALMQRALPVLERLNGHAYQGPQTIKIREAARAETEGYAGRADASCVDECVIQLLPVTSDFIALHEAAHLWSNIYNERWLYEGFADWTAEKAAEELGLAPSVSTPDLDRVTPPEGGLQLINWTEVNCPPIRCPESRDFDLYGYARSLAFINLLEETVGPEALRAANAQIADDGDPVGARGFMDALEQITRQNLDAEFLEWVYTSEDAPLLQQRRQARDQLTALMSEISSTDLVLPTSIAAFIEAWEFEQALQLMPRAAEVVPVYNEAQTAAAEDRSIWQRIGLFGSDPDNHVEAARAAFAEGRFEDAGQEAEEALELVEESESEGKRRAMVAAGLAFGLLVGGLALLWLLGRHRVRRSPYHV